MAKITGTVSDHFRDKKLVVYVQSWSPSGGNSPPVELLVDVKSAKGSNYPHAIVCEKGTSLRLTLTVDTPCWGFESEIKNDLGIVYSMTPNLTIHPYEPEYRVIRQYTHGPFKDKAILVDDVAGMRREHLDWKNSWKMVVKAWPVTTWTDRGYRKTDKTYGPGFPARPRAVPSFSMAVGDTDTRDVTGGGIRGGENVDPITYGGEAKWTVDKTPEALMSVPIYVFVGKDRAFLQAHVQRNVIDAGEFDR